ncbi:DUF488 domain-containing protein [Trichloromonas sp.]|uniref:DUF488 domain-containing protein n=1 Tax=Trichloromonas sp. TaxID=3069249 RepID=UPI003D818371
MKNNTCILTIGYGNRSIDQLIELLLRYNVHYLIDLRTSPYSKFKIEFNREAFEKKLKESNIKYVFMGDTIGGLPSDRSCYTDDQVDYDKVKEKEFYKEGISRLISAYNGGHSVAIMCSEGKPEMCHRSKLVAVTLEESGVPVMHIDECGELATQEAIIRKIVGDQLDLFNSNPTEGLKSKGKY